MNIIEVKAAMSSQMTQITGKEFPIGKLQISYQDTDEEDADPTKEKPVKVNDDGTPKDKWVQHFDNPRRFKVCIPEPVYNEIISNPDLDTLDYRYKFEVEKVTVGADGQPKTRAAYHRFTIVKLTSIIGSI